MADKSEMKKLLLTPVLGNNPIALQVLGVCCVWCHCVRVVLGSRMYDLFSLFVSLPVHVCVCVLLLCVCVMSVDGMANVAETA